MTAGGDARHGNQVILPPGPIGLLGGGQLGQMFVLAAKAMGYQVHVLTDEAQSPAAQIADVVHVGPYDDIECVRTLASQVQALTVEFENVSAKGAEAATHFAPLRPGALPLAVAQNRWSEKGHIQSLGIPVAPFAPLASEGQCSDALAQVGPRGVLKTASSGYDGKGQIKVFDRTNTPKNDKHRAEHLSDEGPNLLDAWQALGRVPCVYERWVDFDCELSLVAARGANGEFRDWGLIRNEHASHILDVSTAPAVVGPKLLEDAREMVKTLADSLEYVGVLCVEFFLLTNGQLMVNEMAPRPHNSGHLTLEASVTSQFEQQVRAVCGLPLGDTRLHSPAAMANLLGHLWSDGSPCFDRVLQDSTVKLHLYGKAEARVGRKMGHVTALAETSQTARDLVLKARARMIP